MHHHDTVQSARGCSRFCAQNQADREYYQKHGHYREDPRDNCPACRELKRRAEDKRKAEEAQRARH